MSDDHNHHHWSSDVNNPGKPMYWVFWDDSGTSAKDSGVSGSGTDSGGAVGAGVAKVPTAHSNPTKILDSFKIGLRFFALALLTSFIPLCLATWLAWQKLPAVEVTFGLGLGTMGQLLLLIVIIFPGDELIDCFVGAARDAQAASKAGLRHAPAWLVRTLLLSLPVSFLLNFIAIAIFRRILE